MTRWRVGEDIGSKEKDRCPLTETGRLLSPMILDGQLAGCR
jgi:hypothetical protein